MDPLTIAGLIMAAYSAYAQNESAQKVQDQRDTAGAIERQRQKGIDEQRQAAVQQAQKRFDPGTQQQEQKSIADTLQQTLTPTSLAASNADYLPGNPGAPQAVNDSLTARLTDALTKGKDYAKRMADVNSYGKLNFGNAQTLNRLGETTSQLNSNAGNSANVYGLELGAAPLAGKTQAGVADAAGGLGNLLFLKGITSNAKAPVIDKSISLGGALP